MRVNIRGKNASRPMTLAPLAVRATAAISSPMGKSPAADSPTATMTPAGLLGAGAPKAAMDMMIMTAIAVTALIFGLLHLIPRRRLWPFAVWAVWEGALLGGIYVWSGSLLVVVVLHTLHDAGGFGLFAIQRRMAEARASA